MVTIGAMLSEPVAALDAFVRTGAGETLIIHDAAVRSGGPARRAARA